MRQQAGIPARMTVTDQNGAAAQLTGAQYASVMGAYNAFQHRVKTSIIQVHSHRASLPGGGMVEMRHSFGTNTMRVVVPKVIAPVVQVPLYWIYDTFDGDGPIDDHQGQIGANWLVYQGGNIVYQGGDIEDGVFIAEDAYIATDGSPIQSANVYLEIEVEYFELDDRRSRMQVEIFGQTAGWPRGWLNTIWFEQRVDGGPSSTAIYVGDENYGLDGYYWEDSHWTNAPPINISYGVKYKLRAEFRGNEAELFVDGASVGIFNHSEIAYGDTTYAIHPDLSDGTMTVFLQGVKLHDIKVGPLP